MSYPVYNNAALLASGTAATYKKNKGVLIVNGGSAETSAVLNVFSDPGGGTQGDAITVIVGVDHAPILFPIRVHSTGTVTGCAVYELI